jgi:hypothetical protein
MAGALLSLIIPRGLIVGHRTDRQTASLAGIETGDLVRIHSIPATGIRTYCEAVGIVAGDVLSCRNAARYSLLLVTAQGRTVSLDRDRARFIRVSRPAGRTTAVTTWRTP